MNTPLTKDAPLEVTIKRIEDLLQSRGIDYALSEVKNPLPNCFSVNIAYTHAPAHIFANGKGTSKNAALASALAEFVERLESKNLFGDYYTADAKHFGDEVAFEAGGEYLSDDLFAIYDPDDLLSYDDLVDFNSSSEKIVCVPYYKLDEKLACEHDTKEYYFPINILQNLYASNGLASGNTPDEARSQALGEIFERFVKFEVIKNSYALPIIEDLREFTRLEYDIKKLRSSGVIVNAHDASLGGKYPVCAISLLDPHSCSLFLSFGSSSRVEVALQRCLTELLQGRESLDLTGFSTPTLDDDLLSSHHNLESHFIDSNGVAPLAFLSSNKSFDLTLWEYSGASSSEDLAFMISKLDGKEAYIREMSHLGFYVCSIVVPNFSEIYPLDDLLHHNKNRGKRVRELLFDLSECDYDYFLDELGAFSDASDVGKIVGVIFASSFSVADLKAQLLLLSGELEEARWLLEESSLAVAKPLKELLIAKLARRDVSDLEDAFVALFGEELFAQAKSILEAKEMLFSLDLDPLYFSILDLHSRLA